MFRQTYAPATLTYFQIFSESFGGSDFLFNFVSRYNELNEQRTNMGSEARGEARSDSDIDLLILLPEEKVSPNVKLNIIIKGEALLANCKIIVTFVKI